MSESRCDHYDFVSGIRKLRSREWNEGCGPCSKMTVASWSDGETGQIASMLSEKVSNKDKSCQIIRSKNSPKRAGREAGCNLTNYFKSMKNGAKTLTMRSDPSTLSSS